MGIEHCALFPPRDITGDGCTATFQIGRAVCLDHARGEPQHLRADGKRKRHRRLQRSERQILHGQRAPRPRRRRQREAAARPAHHAGTNLRPRQPAIEPCGDAHQPCAQRNPAALHRRRWCDRAPVFALHSHSPAVRASFARPPGPAAPKPDKRRVRLDARHHHPHARLAHLDIAQRKARVADPFISAEVRSPRASHLHKHRFQPPRQRRDRRDESSYETGGKERNATAHREGRPPVVLFFFAARASSKRKCRRKAVRVLWGFTLYAIPEASYCGWCDNQRWPAVSDRQLRQLQTGTT